MLHMAVHQPVLARGPPVLHQTGLANAHVGFYIKYLVYIQSLNKLSRPHQAAAVLS
jgi:hypothetical protein